MVGIGRPQATFWIVVGSETAMRKRGTRYCLLHGALCLTPADADQQRSARKRSETPRTRQLCARRARISATVMAMPCRAHASRSFRPKNRFCRWIAWIAADASRRSCPSITVPQGTSCRADRELRPSPDPHSGLSSSRKSRSSVRSSMHRERTLGTCRSFHIRLGVLHVISAFSFLVLAVHPVHLYRM
jgi:hypothetical protein